MLKEREELLSTKPGSKDAAEASHRIRGRIKQLKDDGQKLQALQKVDEKKAMKDKLDKPQENGRTAKETAKLREETVELVFKHIEELEQLEKKRYQDKTSQDRAALFDGAAGSSKMDFVSFGDSKPTGKSQMPPGLPDIDDDPETSAGLQQLQTNNKDLDQDLDLIRSNLGVLKEIAINMD